MHGHNTLAFYPYIVGGQRTIDANYADGVLITRGSPRQHLWTYVGGISEYPYYNLNIFALVQGLTTTRPGSRASLETTITVNLEYRVLELFHL